MEEYKLIANENFFDNVLHLLNEGGTWAWPDELEIFTKNGDKLLSNQNALDKIEPIVRHDYFIKRFSLKK